MKVVLDTNVIVSGLNFLGNEREVLELARRGQFELYLSKFILVEVTEVLTRKFGWNSSTALLAVRTLVGRGTVLEPRRLTSLVPDEHPDNRILDCASAASADYLVTGDRRHLPPLARHQSTQIVTAARFLSIIELSG